MRCRLLVVLVFVTVLVPCTAAQSGDLHLGISGGYASFSGEDYKDVEPGFSISGSVLFPATERVLGGIGLEHSSYGIQTGEETLRQTDVYAVARYILLPKAVRPYIGGTIGYSRQSTKQTIGGAEVERSVSGLAAGPALGVLIPVGPFSIELSANVVRHSFGNVQQEDMEMLDTESSTLQFIGKAGVSILLGG